MNEVNYEYQRNYFNSMTKIAFVEDKNSWSKNDLIRNLYLFKLRLNPNEDNEILSILDYFIHLYTQKYISEKEINIARIKIIELLAKVQILLKDEWGKVKMETKGKN